VTDNFSRFVAAGYKRLIPVIPPGAPISPNSVHILRRIERGKDERGKIPGLLNGDGGWHGINKEQVRADEDTIGAWTRMGASSGILTGEGLGAIDIDTRHPATAAALEAIALEVLGPKACRRYGDKPKVLIPISIPRDTPYAKLRFLTPTEPDRTRPAGVEILTDKRYFVASGVHPRTKRPYEWPDGIPALADLPAMSRADLDSMLARMADVVDVVSMERLDGVDGPPTNQEALKAPVELVRDAVAAIPNSYEVFPSRDSWLQMGYAIKAACGFGNDADAMEIWTEWSLRWSVDADRVELADNVAEAWERMPGPYRLGAQWLFAKAREHGWTREAEMWLSKLPALPPEDRDPVVENPFLASAAEREAAGFEFKDFATLARDAIDRAARPLVKGLLDCGALSCVYGDSNVGKTFVAMDIAYHIARGWRWAGLKVAQANVLYVAAEGGGGVAKRVRALMDLHGDPGAAFDVLPQGVDLLDPDADVGPLIAALTRGTAGGGKEYGLVVLDTLARVMAGGDENAAQDMGALIRNVDRVRRATGAHVMLIHHTGKKVENGARGSSALRAALDTELLVADRMVTATKQRDLDGTWACGFDLEVRALGVDADGDIVSSCVVRIICENAFGRSGDGAGGSALGGGGRGLQPAQQVVLDAVTALCSVEGETVSRQDVSNFLHNTGDTMGAKAVGARLAELRKLKQVVSPKRDAYTLPAFWGIENRSDKKRTSLFDQG
jgi:hypothetical protein